MATNINSDRETKTVKEGSNKFVRIVMYLDDKKNPD